MLRMFVGIPVSDDYKTRLDSMVETLGGRVRSRVRWTRPGNWHVSLQFLGSVEEEDVADVRSALRGIDFSSFVMRAGDIGCFPDMRKPRVMWVGMDEGNDECARLSEAVKDAMEPFGFKRGTQPFQAHLTLGRVKRSEPDDFASVLGNVSQEWPELGVDRFILWKSDLTPDGPVYTVVEEFPLGAENA
ncbi:RNA 2',3'-cyclic phosphodiesterase [uncultured Pseudodesulfovibrio sp.]|uniref:RNA 2',3'-cyclic phosphodiesterase n=1 Tax=uncultured Pseudodesulfovibrio sp. TaxID=2035858 RepID=UPI0029C76FC1|nr:RNA 2',3'-cyclic phosphodiesterase [uncultured Pseudodesulfovibrio sp.]